MGYAVLNECPELKIICSENSYAYEYANENGIAVEVN